MVSNFLPTTITNDLGETVLFLPPLDPNNKALALAKALTREDHGMFNFLWTGTRRFLVRTKNRKVGRVWEAHYHSEFSYGWVTFAEAKALVGSLYENDKALRRALDASEMFLEEHQVEISKKGRGAFFPKSNSNPEKLNVRNSEKIAPRNHHKGKGMGGKKGRPEKCWGASTRLPPAYSRGLQGAARVPTVAVPGRGTGE